MLAGRLLGPHSWQGKVVASVEGGRYIQDTGLAAAAGMGSAAAADTDVVGGRAAAAGKGSAVVDRGPAVAGKGPVVGRGPAVEGKGFAAEDKGSAVDMRAAAEAGCRDRDPPPDKQQVACTCCWQVGRQPSLRCTSTLT